jgi:MFS family permease
VNLFTPDAIILGGSIMKSAGTFLGDIREVMQRGCRFVPLEKVELSLASLGDDANLIGAARVWHHRFAPQPLEEHMARNRFLVGLIFLVFFVISLLSNILGPIVPDIIRTFSVSLGAAGLLVFAFFIAYGVMSIPAGFLVERYSEKPVMIGAFVGAALGSITFALHPTYKMAFVSLFVIGVGMAMLQVAINPLLRVSGGEEHFALNETIAQLIFGSASFLSPWIYSYLVIHLPEGAQRANPLLAILQRITPPRLPWVSLYWIFAVVAATMVVVLLLSRFPDIQHTAEERPGTLAMYKSLVRRRLVWLYFLAIFTYVGCEQGTANWISQFLSPHRGYEPHTTGARAVSWFWGLMTAGCFGRHRRARPAIARPLRAGFYLCRRPSTRRPFRVCHVAHLHLTLTQLCRLRGLLWADSFKTRRNSE